MWRLPGGAANSTQGSPSAPSLKPLLNHASSQASVAEALPRGARLAHLLATGQLRSWAFPLDPARQIVAELAAHAATRGPDAPTRSADEVRERVTGCGAPDLRRRRLTGAVTAPSAREIFQRALRGRGNRGGDGA